MVTGFKQLSWFRKIVLFVFTVHLFAFFIFLIKKMGDDGFEVEHLGVKVSAVVLFILIVFFLYIRLLSRRKIFRIIGRWFTKAFFLFYPLALLYFLLGFFINPPVTFTQLKSLISGYGLKRDYVNGKNLGTNMKLAVIASEDQLFPDHDGFDVKAIKKAIKYNQKNPKKQRGASTISQQTAKNIFLWQGGNFLRKGMEVYFTFTMESIWPKNLILNRYLNIAEMGPGVFGTQAAAKHYFGKNAKDLTEAEAARIAAILPSPKRYKIDGGYVAKRTAAIQRQMRILKADADVMKVVQ